MGIQRQWASNGTLGQPTAHWDSQRHIGTANGTLGQPTAHWDSQRHSQRHIGTLIDLHGFSIISFCSFRTFSQEQLK